MKNFKVEHSMILERKNKISSNISINESYNVIIINKVEVLDKVIELKTSELNLKDIMSVTKSIAFKHSSLTYIISLSYITLYVLGIVLSLHPVYSIALLIVYLAAYASMIYPAFKIKYLDKDYNPKQIKIVRPYVKKFANKILSNLLYEKESV